MDNLQATSIGGDDENNRTSTHNNEETPLTDPTPITALAEVAASVVAADEATGDLPSSSADGIATVTTTTTTTATPDTETETLNLIKYEPHGYEEASEKAESGGSPKFTKVSEDDEDFEEEEPQPKKQKHLSSLEMSSNLDQLAEIAATPSPTQPRVKRMSTASATASASAAVTPITTPSTAKKSKKKSNNVWTKPTSRKGKKKPKNNNSNNTPAEDTVMITPVTRFPDKSDDTPNMKICLSKVYKAEKVELSDDRMSAGSTKGYRMVRATRGVLEGAWYYEIKVVKLGETGHTRLGWSTEKGDLQAPVGYDANSFGYRDIDGSKIHKALREKYGDEGYKEGDVIGFYINLPDGDAYAPKPPHLVWYKGQRYACAAPDGKEDPPQVVPGSQISFFKNGVCQGVAFQDLYGGRYYPAASMYTLPNQPNCTVKFNFGPDFEFFPADFDGRPTPRPMVEVSYHGYDGKVENGIPRASIRRCPTLKVVDDQDINLVEALDV